MKRFLFTILLLLVGAGVEAQAPIGDAPKVLPDRFGAWTGTSVWADIGRTDSPAQEVFAEASHTSREARRYARGDKTLLVILDEFRDPSGAYEIYTQRLSTKLNPSTVAPLTAAGNDQLIALVGNRVVEVSGIRGASDADLKLLLDKLKQSSDQAPLPPIRGYLPDADLVQGSQKYALGPAGFNAALQSVNEGKFSAIAPGIGFNKGAEAMLASYHSASGRNETLILVEYPTPQIAEQQLKHIQPILSANPDLSDATVERKNSLLSLVLSPVSVKSAASLRDNIRYGIAVTWNEGSHTLTDPPWLLVVKNLFLGTLAFCGVAIVLGIAFGGLRVITKKLFPGKVFDRHQDIEVLQLGLTSKRIDPTDLY
jgi:hypothetical protein